MSGSGDWTLDRVERALHDVGRLSADQAARLSGWTPQVAGQRLRHLVDEGRAVAFQKAYWHPRCPRRGSRHRAFVAELYVRLTPLSPGWCFSPASPGAYRPDGWLVSETDPSVRIALEADRGTERAQAWQEKLTRFIEADCHRLVVAVPDLGRAARVRGWVQDRGVHALVLPMTEIGPDAVVAYLQEPLRKPDAPALDSGPGSPPREAAFVLDGVSVPRAVFEAAMAGTAHAAGLERLAGLDRWHAATGSGLRRRPLRKGPG